MLSNITMYTATYKGSTSTFNSYQSPTPQSEGRLKKHLLGQWDEGT